MAQNQALKEDRVTQAAKDDARFALLDANVGGPAKALGGTVGCLNGDAGKLEALSQQAAYTDARVADRGTDVR